MAELNVERRKGPSPWVWIIGLIVLAVIVWLVITMVRGEDPAGVIDDPPRIDTPQPQGFREPPGSFQALLHHSGDADRPRAGEPRGA